MTKTILTFGKRVSTNIYCMMDTTMKNTCTTKNNCIGLTYDILTTLSVADCKIKVDVKNVVTIKAILAGTALCGIQYELKFKIISKIDGANA